jgi:hypothetical protein
METVYISPRGNFYSRSGDKLDADEIIQKGDEYFRVVEIHVGADVVRRKEKVAVESIDGPTLFYLRQRAVAAASVRSSEEFK